MNANDVRRAVVGILGLSRREYTESPSESWSVEMRTLVRGVNEPVAGQIDAIRVFQRPEPTPASDTADEDGTGLLMRIVLLPSPVPRVRREIFVPGRQDFSPRRLPW